MSQKNEIKGTNVFQSGKELTENFSVRSVTTTDTATTSDDVLILSGSSFTQNLFTAAGNTGKVLTIIHNGTNLTQVYTVDGNSSETIGGSTTFGLYTNGEVLKIMSDGSNWVVLEHRAETDWVDAGTITITAVDTGTPTNPGKGTTGRDKVFWRRSGKTMHIKYEYSHTTAGTAGVGYYVLTVPGSQTIDTTSLNTSTTLGAGGNSENATSYIGEGHIGFDSAVGNCCDMKIYAYDSTRLAAYLQGGTNAYWTATYFAFNTADLGFGAHVRVPISGWRD